VSTKLSETRRALLARLEQLVGDECYNGNIQNWGPGGVFEGEGRNFRYPITFRDATGSKVKRWSPDNTIPDQMFKGGYYAFGANELHIISALERVLTHLEAHYGLKIEEQANAK
jgi:hypothetical protein